MPVERSSWLIFAPGDRCFGFFDSFLIMMSRRGRDKDRMVSGVPLVKTEAPVVRYRHGQWFRSKWAGWCGRVIPAG